MVNGYGVQITKYVHCTYQLSISTYQLVAITMKYRCFLIYLLVLPCLWASDFLFLFIIKINTSLHNLTLTTFFEFSNQIDYCVWNLLVFGFILIFTFNKTKDVTRHKRHKLVCKILNMYFDFIINYRFYVF